MPKLPRKNLQRKRKPLKPVRIPSFGTGFPKKPVVPAFRRRAAFGEFEFLMRPFWRYFDAHVSELPHLVLLDGHSKARFTLGFREDAARHSVSIFSIQREHSQFVPVPGKPFELAWSSAKENEAAALLRSHLKMHPSEFLLSEFIFRNRERLQQGWKVSLNLSNVFAFLKGASSAHREKVLAPYRSLVTRFFKPDPNNPTELFELDFKKKRVQELLAEKP